MSNNQRGKAVCALVNRAMPCFFKNLNHIIHRFKESDFNLNGNQIKLINAVKILRSVSPAALSRILDMQKGSLTTIISSLVEQNLLRKDFSPSDPRRYNLSITPEALQLLKNKDRSDAVKYQKIFTAMPDADFQQVIQALTTLVKYLDKYGESTDD